MSEFSSYETPILHIDMDAFYVAVEVRDQPELAGKPVVVGGIGKRGVVAAASYEARVFGVRSAMPAVRARRLCPEAIFLPGDHKRYSEVSRQIMKIFADVTPLVEPLSLDEAFLDVAGAGRLLGDPLSIAQTLRDRIQAEQSLSASVGIAASKLIAKMASGAAKPVIEGFKVKPGRGIYRILPQEEKRFLNPLPIRALWGIGPRTAEKLVTCGVTTIGDLAVLDLEILVSVLGEASAHSLHALANGCDNRPVDPYREAKSISHEETFQIDITDRIKVQTVLVRQSDAVSRRLRGSGFVAKTVGIKLRLAGFETYSRVETLAGPTNSAVRIREVAERLFDRLALEKSALSIGVRLLGVAVSGFENDRGEQLCLDLFGDRNRSGLDTAADMAMDEIRSRYGDDAIGWAAAVLGSTSSTPWGPLN